MIFEGKKENFSICLNDVVLIRHSDAEPAFFAGTGQGESNLYRGNFKVLDRKVERFPLQLVGLDEQAEQTILTLKRPNASSAEVTISFGKFSDEIHVRLLGGLDRFWLRLQNETGEHLWGGGEQFSHFNLSGRRFPMWVQ